MPVGAPPYLNASSVEVKTFFSCFRPVPWPFQWMLPCGPTNSNSFSLKVGEAPLLPRRGTVPVGAPPNLNASSAEDSTCGVFLGEAPLLPRSATVPVGAPPYLNASSVEVKAFFSCFRPVPWPFQVTVLCGVSILN